MKVKDSEGQRCDRTLFWWDRIVAGIVVVCAAIASIGLPPGVLAAGSGSIGVGDGHGDGERVVSIFRLQQPASTTATPRIVLPTKPADAAATGTASAAAATLGTPVPIGSATVAAGGATGGEATPAAGADGDGSSGAGAAPPAQWRPGTGGQGPGTVGAGPLRPGANGAPAAAGAAMTGAENLTEAEKTAARRALSGAGDGSPAKVGPRGVVAVPVPAPEVVRRWAESGSPWGAEETPLSRLVDGRPWLLGWWPSYVLLAMAAAIGLAWVWRRVEDAAGR